MNKSDFILTLYSRGEIPLIDVNCMNRPSNQGSLCLILLFLYLGQLSQLFLYCFIISYCIRLNILFFVAVFILSRHIWFIFPMIFWRSWFQELVPNIWFMCMAALVCMHLYHELRENSGKRWAFFLMVSGNRGRQIYHFSFLFAFTCSHCEWL